MTFINNPKVLAVIPARGGSKRLPRKNIMPIAGHPMIAYSIMSVRDSTMVTDWLLSSDDDEIIEVAKRYGAFIPFKRPPELATDDIRNIDVTLHALEYMERLKGYQYDIIILLQPTSPIRSSEHIDEAITKLINSNLDSLAAVKGPFQKRDPILKRINEKGELVAYCNKMKNKTNEPFYIYNASLYAVKRDYFVTEKKFTADNQIPLVMDKYHSTDVDEISDLIVAETYLNKINSERE
ncbi:MAG: acylneuraminate cytidylyltransferase family protein [Methylophilaceae bacterium]|jgi:CMP-N,N'-diacetyllegionaminic acid synthase|nr:acylneuraminate cytidylyltransferase family protein [Methylophilaceae bacterium]